MHILNQISFKKNAFHLNNQKTAYERKLTTPVKIINYMNFINVNFERNPNGLRYP